MQICMRITTHFGEKFLAIIFPGYLLSLQQNNESTSNEFQLEVLNYKRKGKNVLISYNARVRACELTSFELIGF